MERKTKVSRSIASLYPATPEKSLPPKAIAEIPLTIKPIPNQCERGTVSCKYITPANVVAIIVK